MPFMRLLIALLVDKHGKSNR